MSTRKPSEPNAPLIHASWQRSSDYGLSPEHALHLDIASRSQLSERLEANARLMSFAQPVMEHLHCQLARSSSMVLLADRDGLVLRTVGDGDFVDRAQRVALAPGAHWREAVMGTNAIGTAAHEERTVAVYGDQHFLARNRFLTCIATPIHTPTGGMLGILDLSSDARVTLPHAQALLTSTAEMIEHRLIESLDTGRVLVRFSPHAEMLGTPIEGIAVFDDTGHMIGCNRRARAILGVGGSDPLPHFDACFQHDWQRLPVLVEASTIAPVHLRTSPPPGLSARLQWCTPPKPIPRQPPAPPPAPAKTPLKGGFDLLDHGDPRMQLAIRRARRVAGHDIPLLIQGETGSGKELFARAFHVEGPRSHAPFVAVNCAAIPATLIESELFGYAPGAFTGAKAKGAPGRLQDADGGTLFLDEIGDMPLPLQAVLLRVLETRCVTPLGSSNEIPIDIALVCASHRPLHTLVSDGRFRADLLFRLNGLSVTLPALRERTDFDRFLDCLLAEAADGRPVRLSEAVRSQLRAYPWPGNVRQLKNALRVMVALLDDTDTVIEPAHLPEDLVTAMADTPPVVAASEDLRSCEQRLVRACLQRHGGNVSAAARELGITRTTLYRKLRQDEATPGGNANA
ncbi:sigma-54-dependent Fis family transcriptional regulator [Denitromonas iodatirespirans]|uniref:Sigma-54-dependent Fis family transcriptional regulator n=1 Tax=Denitromonas iodatirespirans TaxID=2795389 RepID=A0A944DA42_DENI1|nr:sigma-54-dependent Fis family transcriptional regulator [Denitromonas iodatirespirans]MBT0961542.1 sigma-54-dependent Fis family transcriptional regulator [Denitromonas iodatirespirans]